MRKGSISCGGGRSGERAGSDEVAWWEGEAPSWKWETDEDCEGEEGEEGEGEVEERLLRAESGVS